MSVEKKSLSNGVLGISLSGAIDSLNAPAVEREIRSLIPDGPLSTIILDCENLESTSSAGLRIFLRLKQTVEDTRIVNAKPEVYDVLEITGFTEIMDVRKAYREISVEGCEVIGQGANGKVYRVDRDTIVKVYLNPDSLPEIHRERELARTAFVSGVPTAIPYDVVRIKGGGYGSVFELLNAVSFAKLLESGEKTLDEVAEMSIDLLKLIHSKVVKPDIMPDMRAVALNWVCDLKDHLPADQHEKLRALMEAVPEDMHMMHGDYHVRNVMLQNGEVLLIDMDTLCHGHPIFELSAMYNAYVGFGETDPSIIQKFLGISPDTARAFWQKSLALYLGTDDETVLRSVERKAKVISHARIVRRLFRRNLHQSADGRAMLENSLVTLAELLPETDTLVF